jgi:hypothetical protein
MGDRAFTDPVFPDSAVIVGVEAAFAEERTAPMMPTRWARQSRAMVSSIYAGPGTPAHPGALGIVVGSNEVYVAAQEG